MSRLANEGTEALAVAYGALAGRAGADDALRVMAAKGRREMQANGFDLQRLASVPDISDTGHVMVVSKGLAAARTKRMADPPVPKSGDDGRAVNVLKALWAQGFGLAARKPLGEHDL